ncbi:MAG: flagellar basal body rod protein FlgC [bacterium]
MKIRGIFSAIDISATGLSAQRQRMDAIAENIANVNTTRTPDGGPFRRRISVFTEQQADATTLHLQKDPPTRMTLESSAKGHMKPFETYMKQNQYSGVARKEIRDNTTPEYYYDPQHPDANEFGYVAKPKINIITEMVDMIAATRNYEANVSAIEAAKQIAKKAMEI